MKHIAIFGNDHQSTNIGHLQQLFSLLCNNAGLQISVDRNYTAFLRTTINLPESEIEVFDDYDFNPDLVLSIGGDGTFLTTARRVGATETPIMGINSGHLGYLSAADITESAAIVDDIIHGNYVVEARSAIAVSCADDLLPDRPFALNEVAILKQDTASMITVETHLNGAPLAAYRGDGLIISTPTGSTSYNLSVGGPIVAPSAADWIISPIAAHSLNMRPLVVSDSIRLDISTHSRSNQYLLSIDGKATALPIDSRLTLTKAKHSVNVVHNPRRNFIDTLRHKLLWGM